ncbi:Double zinc ribbon [Caprobacter fermentans]|uniref:Double zinc ribbon n=1 Tax=Caproicibacter fermentans TaxID=2576756 RepID=A0A6N8I023_9FIRM|nr:zinc ribbon domain-containing protein [Caproicibacter fermentans]MVB11352.1 Double zinc ribbon [Caproicibacter fermentans]
MFCRKCGKSIPEDSVFCPYCGETVKFEKPAAGKTDIVSYGHCERCGKPLQANDGTLCAECAAKMIEKYAPKEKTEPNERYPYGACGLCGEPLEADDELLICKKCKAAQDERDRTIKASNRERAETKKHGSAGGIAAILVLVFCAIGMIVYISRNSGSHPVKASTTISSNPGVVDSAIVQENTTESSSNSSTDDLSELKNQALTYAVAWADEHMADYGKISPGTNQSGIIDDGSFVLKYDFRAPNVYGADEKHMIVEVYQKKDDQWNMEAFRLDDDFLFDYRN